MDMFSDPAATRGHISPPPAAVALVTSIEWISQSGALTNGTTPSLTGGEAPTSNTYIMDVALLQISSISVWPTITGGDWEVYPLTTAAWGFTNALGSGANSRIKVFVRKWDGVAGFGTRADTNRQAYVRFRVTNGDPDPRTYLSNFAGANAAASSTLHPWPALAGTGYKVAVSATNVAGGAGIGDHPDLGNESNTSSGSGAPGYKLMTSSTILGPLSAQSIAGTAGSINCAGFTVGV